ncbi:hypothetical protein Scep_028312 [Stephania cephalantha]|uniref:Uncharacterized protein n=1 Tax=Stephania cephalantha TaxID=152367 RepID=A0AAP0E9P3_9MAGN
MKKKNEAARPGTAWAPWRRHSAESRECIISWRYVSATTPPQRQVEFRCILWALCGRHSQ